MAEKLYTFEVSREHEGKRLDKYLVEYFNNEYSRSFIQRLIDRKEVMVDGAFVKSHHPVAKGEAVRVVMSDVDGPPMEAEDRPLDIVYEDGDLLVINKPAGMVVHPAPGNYTGTMVNALLGHCRKLSGLGGHMKPGVVHRLDKGTSGLLVVAKNDRVHAGLGRQFKAKTTKRVYVAVVKGIVEHDNGIIELPIGRSHYDRKKMAVKFEDAKDAVTHYTVLERFADATLVELRLGTGRTHQIRVHMTYIGHPLLGDEKYGTKEVFGRPALHARTIGFTHPVTKKRLEFTSDLPADMQELISMKRAATGAKKR